MGSNVHSRVAALLHRGWAAVPLEPPLVHLNDLRMIAVRAWERTGLNVHDDPRMLAVALGFRVVRAPWLSGCGGEATDSLRLVYRPSEDLVLEQVCAGHGLAHLLLHAERWTHNETDALLLTAVISARCFS